MKSLFKCMMLLTKIINLNILHNIRYNLTGRKVILRNSISKKAVGAVFTHDMWTSCATQGYSTVTTHFISNSWELKAYVLQTRHVGKSHIP